MANSVLTYNVTGRYMTGSTVIAHHLVGTDGSQIVANKERIIYMIGRGQIENMRLQTNGDEILIRGKGINLNTLPIYDMAKGQFRENQASQTAASTNVIPKKNSGISPMGQLKITKRIMYKTSCLGYMVEDMAGREKKFSRKRVMELAREKIISNAVVQKYKPKDSDQVQLVLRGVGCDISSLPAVIVDQNGNVIDETKAQNAIYTRATRMKRGGIIYDKVKNKRVTFEPGDYLVCGTNGVLRPIKSNDAMNSIVLADGSQEAVCDSHLDNLVNYPIELFGSTVQTLNQNQVKRWAVVKLSKTA